MHLTVAADAVRIRRSGLKVQKHRAGVYIMPVTPDFYLTHQWSRELKRWRSGPQIAVYLRIPGDAPVMFGRYGGPHSVGTADEAVAALIYSDQKLGFEAILLRDVAPAEISSIKPMRPITGWRFYPAAKGRTPCGCPGCQSRGEPFSRRFRKRYEADERRE